MKKNLTIAKTVLTLLFRGRGGWGIIALLSILSGAIFLAARSDGVLINELQIRLRYSVYFSSGVLSVILMYLASISLCKDIENRQFHMLTSAPVNRCQIWIGKFIGIMVFGLVAFLSSSIITGVCAYFYISNWDKPEEQKELKEKFFTCYYECAPETPDLKTEIERIFVKRQAAGEIPAGFSDYEARRSIYGEIRKNEQMILPSGKKSWKIPWNPSAAKGDYAILRIKFYAQQLRQKMACRWTLSAEDHSEEWNGEFSGFPYLFNDIKIPLADIPDSEELTLTFKGLKSPYIIFPMRNGIKLLYKNEGIFSNYLKLLIILGLNMGVLVAIALTFASLFTYSVAVFVTIVVYGIGISSDFFTSVIRDLSFEGNSLTAVISTKIINFGLWLTKGIKPPPVIDSFSQSISIPIMKILAGWGVYALLYLLIVSCIAIYFLSRKELDKILHS